MRSCKLEVMLGEARDITIKYILRLNFAWILIILDDGRRVRDGRT
jgi:hypothetical protein